MMMMMIDDDDDDDDDAPCGTCMRRKTFRLASEGVTSPGPHAPVFVRLLHM
jgi:hypothetical protein